jgi:hypothetical protein
MKLSESQLDVVEFLRGLPNANFVRLHEEMTVAPGTGVSRSKLLIMGGGDIETPCPCGRNCGHTKKEPAYAEFEWRNGTFYAARQSVRDKNRSISEVKKLTREKLGIEE